MIDHADLKQTLTVYLQKLEMKHREDIAREHAYRAALQELLECLEPGINAINDPARQALGAPDFSVLRREITLGWVETKDIGTDLSQFEQSEQFQRYSALHNLIVTDYLEFRWYVDGARRMTARLGHEHGARLRLDEAGASQVADLLTEFILTEAITINTPKELAERMARITRHIQRQILSTYAQEGRQGPLHDQQKAFQETLIPDLSAAQFADMYAQTMAYGLFGAAVRWTSANKQGEFNRYTAEQWLPATNPFMKKLFRTIGGVELPPQVGWLVEDSLVGLLKRADLPEILRDFGQKTRKDDPVVHFYEDFLAAYDPALRERRGVYYTPEPVVSYIVRSVDHLLKTKFDRPDGLKDTNTMILDPATGTGTFLYFVIQQIHEQFKGQEGAWDRYVQDHLLPRIFGFELLMAPYAMAHMKLGIQLQETGYQFGGDQRLGIYLTNTLEEAIKTSETLPFMKYISDEGNEAARVKRDEPIMVVLGNPPYSVHSANKGEWIDSLIRDYYVVDGEPLDEKNPKNLQNDYVKFIRFGQWRITTTGVGILAFVTNHGYLDSPTFRGMRRSLMESFNDIYIVNLHGNNRRKEKSPDGSVDDNVFDIQQGVAIALFVKQQGTSGATQVHYLDLWGKRTGKYAWLFDHALQSTTWQSLLPQAPYYLFVPQDTSLLAEYDSGWQIPAIFPVNSTGIKTHRDNFVVDFSEQSLKRRITEFRGEDVSNDTLSSRYGLTETKDWQITEHRQALRSDPEWERGFIQCLYRPFDTRSMFYHAALVDRRRDEVMRHLRAEENIALSTVRGVEIDRDFEHVFCSNIPMDHHAVSLKETDYLFPVYVYPDPGKLVEHYDWPAGKNNRRPNLNPKFVKAVADRLTLRFVSDGKGDLTETFGPEDIFSYIYAILYDSTYRVRYEDSLRRDFPRVPLTSDRGLFAELVRLGAELIDLHLLRHVPNLITTYPVKGTDQVASGHPRYAEPNEGRGGQVYINAEQYFEGVEPEVWEFHIGGYQVLDKWLKDRRGRALSYEDIRHYQRIVAALKETMRIMGDIDEAIEAAGGWPIQ